ncbi:MAG TPA: carotenoid biosynthesis protein [Candidatus Saccharimonadales bacterium]|nr:carotenoid biosynthesis protein [Candidatus Saccharimonadales bacterium]
MSTAVKIPQRSLSHESSPVLSGALGDCLLLGLIGAAFVISILQGIEFNRFVVLNGPAMLVVVCVLFTFIHGLRRYGWKHLLVFFAISTFFGMFYENLSITTGFPFGWYHYSDQLGPKFIHAPYILNIAYFQMLYLSWTMASILLEQYAAKLRGAYRWVLPIVASFVMVMWDVVIDPNMSTMLGHWIWHGGGAYFGVPFGNYLGWFLCVFSMYQTFGFYSAKINEEVSGSLALNKKYWLQAIAIYCAWPVTFVLRGFFADPTLTVTSLDHQVWKVAYLYQTSGLAAIVTMYFVAVLAGLKIVLNKR